MALMVMPVPILPGKTEQWKAFRDELLGRRFAEYADSRRRLGVQERVYFYSAPQGGDWAIVTLEGKDPTRAFRRFGIGNDEFTRWFVQQVKEIHGLDLTNPGDIAIPQLELDTGSGGISQSGGR